MRQTKKLAKTDRLNPHKSTPAFRREVLALHRAIFRANKKRIHDCVADYSASFRRYERTYAQGVSRFIRRTTDAQVHKAIARSDVVFVGDYHTLARAQRAFIELCRTVPTAQSVIVALEFVCGRHQPHIDAYQAGAIDEYDFLRRIGYAERQGSGTWQSFSQIFALCKSRGWRIIGIDSRARGATSLQTRDAFAARCIAGAMQHHPGAKVMVLVGELHIAPSHLPQAVRTQAAAQGRAPQSLIIYQNCERIYRTLVERGQEQEVTAVLVAPSQFCLLNTPPIICQQSFLNTLTVQEDGEAIEDPTQTFKDYANVVARFFKLPIGEAAEEVELTTVADLSFLQRLARRGIFNKREMRTIERQVLASESYYIPRANMVYLGNLSVNHVSEEATHFIRHVCARVEMPTLLIDAFYARCIEEALGFLGSKVINPRRTRPKVAYFRQIVRQGSASARQKALARLVLMHARMETGVRVSRMAEVYNCDADTFNAITHVLGYRLGDRLYEALMHERISQARVRSLFFEPFEEEGAALATYLYLMFCTRAKARA